MKKENILAFLKERKYLVIATVVLLLTAIILTLLNKSKKIVSTPQTVCNNTICTNGCCLKGMCLSKDYSYAGYTCTGDHKWSNPQLDVITVLPEHIVSLIEENIQDGMANLTIHPVNSDGTIPGCVFSVSYEVEGKVDQNLKQTAWMSISVMRDRILSGKTTIDVYKEHIITDSKNNLWQKQLAAYGLITLPPVSKSPDTEDISNLAIPNNFCFQTKKEALLKAGDKFVQENKILENELLNIQGDKVSEVFLLRNNNGEEFAWMFISTK
ncbi:hypothetical protein A2Y99_03550 [Candidatus Gottesmanbacteria bacterium RBG_13_37_7]|uniref:Uncharacterized protein n=1 Tax=Candidatus Gottesmanbacteria bacterium RBG_13_37_7 TaxID=1798369 RepID=A0A1F5YJ71_9BACT|nr:MAG: hypothetical protein A2Y99_03550 [Candidatus Gottesmanbacteria bacterium RBG_13_37_7]